MSVDSISALQTAYPNYYLDTSAFLDAVRLAISWLGEECMNKQKAKTQKTDEYTRFEQTLRNLVAVPKSEVDKEKEKYERQREKEGKRKRPAK